MKSCVKLFLMVMFVLSTIPATCGQQPLSDESLIEKLRTNIQRMKENAPPKESPNEAGYRDTMLSLQSQLRDLLIEKRGALKSRIQNLEAPDALPQVLAHVQQLKMQLRAVNDEAEGIDRELGSAVEADSLTLPARVSTPAQPSTPEESEKGPERAKFEEAIKRISGEDLKAAAAPAEVATSKAIVPCNESGRPAAVNNYSQLDEAVCRLAQKLVDGDRSIVLARDLSQMFTILTAKLLKTETASGESYAAFVSEAQEIRTDQQMGAGPSSSGTTSLVSKGGIPYLFGLAVENGAATQSQSDTTITFRVNPAGVLDILGNKGFITGFRNDQNDPFLKFLGKTSLGFSFDTSRGNQPGVFTGDKQQLSAFSARVQFVNERDPRQKKYEADWERFVADEGVKLAQQVWKTTTAVIDLGGNRRAFSDPALQAWLNQMNENLGSARANASGTKEQKINAIANAIREQSDLVPVKLVSPESLAALTNFAEQDKAYIEAKNRLFDKIAKGKVFTLEYTNNREVSAPDTSNFNFIAATGSGARVDLTANGSLTFFNKRPVPLTPTGPHVNRVRDFQFAGQIDVPFKVGDGQLDFWFSGRYERLLSDASTFAGTIMPGTKGDIAVGQFGLNLPIKSLGIKFPVSFTFANRTELVKEKEIRGNFGFTFNWDTLWSKLKPF